MKRLSTELKFALFVAAVTIIRLIAIVSIPLGGDEAYYWLWSKHLSLGYYDHPPFISLLIKFFSIIGGDHLLFVRIGTVLFAAVGSWMVYLLARRITRSTPISLMSGVLFTVCPIFAVKALEISPDSPLIAFTLIYIYFTYLAIFEDRKISWLWAGLALGFALLTKLTAFLLPVSLVLYLVLSVEHRKHLIKPWPYVSGLVSLLIFSPFLWWCAHNSWITFMFHFVTRVSQEAQAWQNQFPRFVEEQSFIITPFLLILCILAPIFVLRMKSIRAKEYNNGLLFLTAFGIVPIVAFGIVSTKIQIFPHWTMPAYPTLLILTAIFYQKWKDSGDKFKIRYFKFSVGFAVLISCLFYLAAGSVCVQSLFVKPEYNEIFGYAGLSEKILDTTSRNPNLFVLTDSYARSSSLSYYTRRQVYLISKTEIMGKEFLRWQNFKAMRGMDALYVQKTPLSDRKEIQDILKSSFERLEPEQAWAIYSKPDPIHKRPYLIKTFYVTVCKNFKRNNFYDEKERRLLSAIHKPYLGEQDLK